MILRQGGDPALGETFRSPSKFTRGLNPTPSFSPKAEEDEEEEEEFIRIHRIL